MARDDGASLVSFGGSGASCPTSMRPLFRCLSDVSPAGTTPVLPEGSGVTVATALSSAPPALKLGPFLTKYGVNMTKQAADGRLDPVIGREEEIIRAIQVLSRRTKNNPCLIGEPGVGKTAIAEGLARRIFLGQVPHSMRDKVVVSLDLASMLAGARFRGEFEERLKGVLTDIEKAGDRVILFIDEIHILVGAGGAEGAIDASNILKPPLSRGLLRCLGATTTEEFRKYVEKDAALARRFQAIVVPEPTVDGTIVMLQGLRGKYEAHHGVKIADSAIDAAAKLSNRYMTTRRLPDKAIDLLDEASSMLRMKLESTPQEIEVVETKLAAFKMKGQGGEVAASELEKTLKELTDSWEAFRTNLKNISDLRVQIDLLTSELARVINLGNFARAREIGDTELVEKRALLDAQFTALNVQESRLSLKYEVGEAEIADIVAKSTGIPVGKLLDFEKKSLLRMEEDLSSSVVGQTGPISVIAKCIRLSRAGLRYHDRPLGVFLFLGSTGIGKTELAKSLAKSLFKDVNSILRLDMSEYMERHSVSRLIGSPPGYIGYEEGGVLTESVRQKPYQVILLDEFEKSHRDVSNLLLQVFDEGRLRDSKGNVADFKNTVIILTSNLGSDVLYGDHTLNAPEDIGKQRSKAALAIVNSAFSPEFVNRLDDVICFSPLEPDSIRAITQIQLNRVAKLLKEKEITIDVSDAAEAWLAATGYDAAYGELVVLS